MKKTIAQELNITDFPFEIRDKQGDLIYKEWEDGEWSRWETDGNREIIYYEDSNGYWEKFERDDKGNQIYYENSKGEIEDNRPQPKPEPMTIEIDGKKYKLICIK